MRKRLIASIVLTAVLLLALLASVALVTIVPFLFDAPGTESQAATWIMAGAVLSLPVTIVLALVAVWIARPAGRSNWWYAALALPVLSAVIFWVAGSFRPGFF